MAEESPRTPPPSGTTRSSPPPSPKRRRIETRVRRGLSLNLMDRLGDPSSPLEEDDSAFWRFFEFTVASAQRNLQAMREAQAEADAEAKEDLQHKKSCRILRSFRIVRCLQTLPWS